MAQYLKPDCELGYIEDQAQIEKLKVDNLRHTILGCMLGDFDETGAYVVDPEIVQELINAHADVNAIDNDGGTALITATVTNRTDIIRLLLSAGADINIKDNDGLTALDIAKDNHHSEIITLFKNHQTLF